VNPPPSTGLVVNTCNQPDYLRRVLQAISGLTRLPDEVVLADDGSAEETRTVFERWGQQQRFPTRHAWQPRSGFRRARILNVALSMAASDYLVFLDGDTIPHPRFLDDHRRLARNGYFVQGHRALIGQRGAIFFGLGRFSTDRWQAVWRGELRALKSAYRWPRPWCSFPAGLAGIRGCNLAIWRHDLTAVNGYNEAFVGWGREDSELAVRLGNLGVRRLDARGWALCYHLWHPPASRDGLTANDHLLEAAMASKSAWCEAGLSQHLEQPSPAASKSPFPPPPGDVSSP